MTGPELNPPLYDHPPLVECWLQATAISCLPPGTSGCDLKWDVPPAVPTQDEASALQKRLGPEWPGQWTRSQSDAGMPCLQLTNSMADRALRLIPGGFAFGWLGHGGERYPRYETVRDGFVLVLDAIRTVAKSAGRDWSPRSWTVEYVNRIPQGTVWTNVGDWSFFKLWRQTSLTGIHYADFRGRWELPLEATSGRLSVEFRHAGGATADEPDSIWIKLTATGPILDAETSLFDGLDSGREIIVRNFNELVSDDAKNYWGVNPP